MQLAIEQLGEQTYGKFRNDSREKGFSMENTINYLLYMKMMRPIAKPIDICDIHIFPRLEATSLLTTGVVVCIKPWATYSYQLVYAKWKGFVYHL